MAARMTLPDGIPLARENVDVDPSEVYFLISHFLAGGPCTKTVGVLWDELLQYKLLPRKCHAWCSRNGQPSGNGNDAVSSLPLSYKDVAKRNPDIPNNHLVDLLQQLLVDAARSVTPMDSKSMRITAAVTPTLLGLGDFSLLDQEKNKPKDIVSRSAKPVRIPAQVQGLMLRELGGGFARPHRSPSIPSASYLVAKPSVVFSRIQVIKTLRGHKSAVLCSIFDRSGQRIITGSDDGLVKIWSMETGLCLRSCRGHLGHITKLAVNHSNDLVASTSIDFSIRIWNLENGFPVSVIVGHLGAVTAIAFSPRQGFEDHLLSTSEDGTCRIWNARKPFANSRVYRPDPKEAQIAVGEVTSSASSAPRARTKMLCCSFNVDGSIFVTGSSDKTARVWSARKWNHGRTGRPIYEIDTLHGHTNSVNFAQFTGCAESTRPRVLDKAKQDKCKNVRFPHDSIVTCSRDGTAIVWTSHPFKRLTKVDPRWFKAYHVMTPMPAQLSVCNHPRKPGQRTLTVPRGVVRIVWSLDNRFLLAAMMDFTLCLWDAVDGSLVHCLTGHENLTVALDVHPLDARIAMSVGYDGRVIIWDIWHGHSLRVYDLNFRLVQGQFSPDGSSLVVSDRAGQIHLFATGDGNSQQDAKYEQFFVGDFESLVRDARGNVLDQETNVPHHHINIHDLLCDAYMVPYPARYQTSYQQRRLRALGIDWQPHAQHLGTSDDLIDDGPPDPPVPSQAAVQDAPWASDDSSSDYSASEDSEEETGSFEEADSAKEGQEAQHLGTLDDLIDDGPPDPPVPWQVAVQDAPWESDDSSSEYSASEDSEEEIGSSEEADSANEGQEDKPSLRRSSRNKSKAETATATYSRRSSRNKGKAEVKCSSSGGRLKRKRCDFGAEIQGQGRYSLRPRTKKSSQSSRPSRLGEASSSRRGRS